MRDPIPHLTKRKKFILFTNSKCAGTVLKSWFISSLEPEKYFTSFFSSIKLLGWRFSIRWYKNYKKFHGKDLPNEDNKILRKFVRYHGKRNRVEIE
ncbi:hypothetical protein [Thalassotalea crassostreae]|uniref:hypothetical protein n=1 Tax=Thalassotalea crassostreae TaxID=1763536 RepID=UPI000838EEC5|nr:hypothetical protein [Thalassotalea crassostreae]